ncbi:MAG: hypothetical protein WC847_02255 [Candidatus Paceibacterota bacterium]
MKNEFSGTKKKAEATAAEVAKNAAQAVSQALTATPPPQGPKKKLISFNDGPIVSFTYYGGPLIWNAIGGKVDFVDEYGVKWSHTPGKLEVGVMNQQLHRGVVFASKQANSKATGVEITQVWKD